MQSIVEPLTTYPKSRSRILRPVTRLPHRSRSPRPGDATRRALGRTHWEIHGSEFPRGRTRRRGWIWFSFPPSIHFICSPPFKKPNWIQKQTFSKMAGDCICVWPKGQTTENTGIQLAKVDRNDDLKPKCEMFGRYLLYSSYLSVWRSRVGSHPANASSSFSK